MSFKHWKHLSACEDHMHILDYCKTKACLIGVIPSMGLLLICADVINC